MCTVSCNICMGASLNLHRKHALLHVCENRQQAARLLARWRSGVAAAAFAAWLEFIDAQRSRQALLRAAVMRWQRAQVASLFALWRSEAENRAATLQRLTQVLPNKALEVIVQGFLQMKGFESLGADTANVHPGLKRLQGPPKHDTIVLVLCAGHVALAKSQPGGMLRRLAAVAAATCGPPRPPPPCSHAAAVEPARFSTRQLARHRCGLS